MPTANLVEVFNALQPEEQSLVFSLIRSFINSNDNQRTEAQKKFLEESLKYDEYDMSMEEIDAIRQKLL